MRHFIQTALICLPLGALAEEAPWVAMSGAQITEVLTGQVFEYGSAWQDFRASGRTLYHAGSESWGYWAVRGDQYCSMWPPSDLWACYDMAQRGDAIRFVGQAGDISEAVVRAEGG